MTLNLRINIARNRDYLTVINCLDFFQITLSILGNFNIYLKLSMIKY